MEELNISELQAALQSAEARAREAEARVEVLEALLAEASDAMRMTGLAMEAPLGRVTKRHLQHWTSLFHGTSERVRQALGASHG